MNVDNKGKSTNYKVYIVLGIVAILAVIFIFVLLNSLQEKERAKPLTTTTNPAYDEVTTTKSIAEDLEQNDAPVIATNFRASLKTIFEGLILDGDYEEELKYSGARFNLTCTEYSSAYSKCVKGSVSMDVGTAVVPLYVYTNEDDNYYNRQSDYHIILTDNYIFLSVAKTLNSTGTIKVYTRNGQFIKQINNILLGYKLGQLEITEMYPSLDGDSIYYYACSNRNVVVEGYDLLNKQELGVLENVDQAVCY